MTRRMRRPMKRLMTRGLCALALFTLLVSCGGSQSGNSLAGSESQVYDLSFSSVIITLQGTYVSVKYVGSSGYPALLVVNTANVEQVANVSIDLTQLVAGQPRGVLQNVNGGGTGVTNQLTIMLGSVVFDRVPSVGATLSGEFSATLTDGYTLDGTFSGKVYPPP
jgi:hypothetical protein